VDELARLATEFNQHAKYGFPRYTHPEIAIAYSFDSFIDSHPNGPSNTTLQYFKPPYTEQVQGAFEPFFRANLDTAIINIGHESLSPYKLVVVPADYVMDAASATALREYVSNGGTVLMTAFSAKVDEHGQWFDTPLPGRLSDVFGLKTNAFYDSTALKFELDGKSVSTDLRRYEVLEPSTATVLARFTNIPDHSPAITMNRFGKGNALYLATESSSSTIDPVLERVLHFAGIQAGPSTPDGVYARSVDGRTLYVNTTGEPKKVAIEDSRRGILTNRVYDGSVTLGAFESDLVQ
jgi:beta-galactosidase